MVKIRRSSFNISVFHKHLKTLYAFSFILWADIFPGKVRCLYLRFSLHILVPGMQTTLIIFILVNPIILVMLFIFDTRIGFEQEFDLRKHARNEGRRYCDPIILTYQAERMPEQIRLKVCGFIYSVCVVS